MGKFDTNDINVIIEDRKEKRVEGVKTIEEVKEMRRKVIAESIFLRFFPVSLI